MKWLSFICASVLLIFSAANFAAVTEKKVQRPNQLGSVVIYGNDRSKNQGADATTLKAKILVAHGGAGADLDFQVYPGVKHSFTVPQATAKGEAFGMPFKYDEYADKDSWAALLRMLEQKS